MGNTQLDPPPSNDDIIENRTTRSLSAKSIIVHSTLFLATFVSCTIAGAWWNGSRDPFDVANWGTGVTYACLIMLFISAHEFGHYFAARIHGVDATLPFYIPMPFVNIMPFGTMGAVIRTKTAVPSRKVLFDIGVSGPLAGFVVSLVILIVGFLSLPPKDHIYSIHPEYLQFFGGMVPDFGMYFGDTLVYTILSHILPGVQTNLPPMNEMYHYPFLCVGWFGLFVTSLNLLPIGQLDGGHVVYAMFGKHQRTIARVALACMTLLGLGGLLGDCKAMLAIDSPDDLFVFLQSLLSPVIHVLDLYAPWVFMGWTGWLMWAFFARFFFRLQHPTLQDDTPLDKKRMLVGWIAIAVFVVSFAPSGIFDKSATDAMKILRNHDAVVLLSPQ
ncbi:MAG: site-2 protease family protein [Candidatus Kapaibacterium sp.]|jgi:membrane-associated protease RseP (regulator of RpoE activity)